MLYTYNAYHLLALADYCVTLGKTTLALEALVFGKPLFATPTRDGTKDYYLNNGVASRYGHLVTGQRCRRPLSWDYRPQLLKRSREYLHASFYSIDGKATERSVDVLGDRS